jgi:uncharacterized protein (DUF305 family)
MSRNMSISAVPWRSRATLRRSSAAALALAIPVSVSACGGGDDEAAATAAQESTMGAAADTGPAPGTSTDAAPAAAAPAEDHHAGAADAPAEHDDAGGGAAAGSAAHEHTPGMDMSTATFPRARKAEKIPASAPFNYQDVYFSQHMIAHHGQAVEMAEMLLANTKNPKMRQLANAIHGAQAPEIDMMTGWLKSWKQRTDNPAHGHDPNAASAGMMADEDMAKLHTAKGRTFDRLFLQQVIVHHQGAANQSNAELKKGKYGPAKSLTARLSRDRPKRSSA